MVLLTGALIGAVVIGGLAGASAAGAFDEEAPQINLPGDLEERKRKAISGRSDTILTGGALSQKNQPTVPSALLGGKR
jgi:hypothetical protein